MICSYIQCWEHVILFSTRNALPRQTVLPTRNRGVFSSFFTRHRRFASRVVFFQTCQNNFLPRHKYLLKHVSTPVWTHLSTPSGGHIVFLPPPCGQLPPLKPPPPPCWCFKRIGVKTEEGWGEAGGGRRGRRERGEARREKWEGRGEEGGGRLEGEDGGGRRVKEGGKRKEGEGRGEKEGGRRKEREGRREKGRGERGYVLRTNNTQSFPAAKISCRYVHQNRRKLHSNIIVRLKMIRHNIMP